MTQAPKHHLFRFSLRTLFVVTTAFGIALGYIGYYVDWIRQHRAVLRSIEAGPVGPPGSFDFSGDPRPELPYGLKLLGEKSEHIIWLWLTGEGKQRFIVRATRIQQLFPESHILDFEP